MSRIAGISFSETGIEKLAKWAGRVAVIVGDDGKMDLAARRANRLSKGAVARLVEGAAWAKAKPGDVATLAYPAGMAARALDVIKLARRASPAEARKAGAALAKRIVQGGGADENGKDGSAENGAGGLLLAAGNHGKAGEIVTGLALRAYGFDSHKSGEIPAAVPVEVMCSKPDALEAACAAPLAVAEGVHFTRDLVNEPANHLTTTSFAERLAEMEKLGLTVEVLEEDALRKLGMGALLAVGQGSPSPTKVVVMQWLGGKKGAAPLALIGKGVVFDTGGISLKPSAGMEDMTMDMGGAGVVAGVMRTLALRKAGANVVGLVGLVENMPSGEAMRPGDVITAMKGDTIEVNNTDAEGRLVLADVMWYAQQRFEPSGMIDLATLTGAIIVGLGHEKAGVFANDDALCKRFLKAADAEGEGAWRMPLGSAYDTLLKSRVADVKNSGGRPAGSITAAQFLRRFVKDDMPWIHLDIAGVASVKSETEFAPKGATGWGVMALNRMIADGYEAD